MLDEQPLLRQGISVYLNSRPGMMVCLNPNLGLANRVLDKLDEAAVDFTLAIDIKKDYSRPYNNRGTVYLAQGQPERAIEDFSKAIELDSHFADPKDSIGIELTLKARFNDSAVP